MDADVVADFRPQAAGRHPPHPTPFFNSLTVVKKSSGSGE